MPNQTVNTADPIDARVDFQSLHNRYYAMRHGHSLANAAGIIVSDPVNGVEGYGLSESGQQQVRASADKIGSITAADASHPLVIISSDFKRARETAGIVHQRTGYSQPVTLDIRLRERYFGDFEGQPDTLYNAAWEDDLIDAGESGHHNVESLQSVSRRATSLIDELEKTCSGYPVLLVAHGDILQILQCAFQQMDPSRHRSLDHLGNAEVRLLNQE